MECHSTTVMRKSAFAVQSRQSLSEGLVQLKQFGKLTDSNESEAAPNIANTATKPLCIPQQRNPFGSAAACANDQVKHFPQQKQFAHRAAA